TDYVKVDFSKYRGGDKENIVFKDRYGIKLKLNNDNTLTFIATNKPDTNYIYAYDKDGVRIGKLFVYTYQKQTKNVVLVSVNGAKIDKTITVDGLNKIFNPAVTEFIISEDKIEIPDLETFTHGGSNWHSVYNSDQKLVLETYDKNIKDDNFYLFFVDNVLDKKDSLGTSVSGYMPRGYNCGFIYEGGSLHTIAHELGHGVGNLEHAFVNSNSSGKTKNLMDYSSGEELWHFQWNEIQDPSRVWMKWRKEESEGENISTAKFVCINDENAIKILNEKYQYFYLPDKRIIYLPEDKHYQASGFFVQEEKEEDKKYTLGTLASLRFVGGDYRMIYDTKEEKALYFRYDNSQNQKIKLTDVDPLLVLNKEMDAVKVDVSFETKELIVKKRKEVEWYEDNPSIEFVEVEKIDFNGKRECQQPFDDFNLSVIPSDETAYYVNFVFSPYCSQIIRWIIENEEDYFSAEEKFNQWYSEQRTYPINANNVNAKEEILQYLVNNEDYEIKDEDYIKIKDYIEKTKIITSKQINPSRDTNLTAFYLVVGEPSADNLKDLNDGFIMAPYYIYRFRYNKKENSKELYTSQRWKDKTYSEVCVQKAIEEIRRAYAYNENIRLGKVNTQSTGINTIILNDGTSYRSLSLSVKDEILFNPQTVSIDVKTGFYAEKTLTFNNNVHITLYEYKKYESLKKYLFPSQQDYIKQTKTFINSLINADRDNKLKMLSILPKQDYTLIKLKDRIDILKILSDGILTEEYFCSCVNDEEIVINLIKYTPEKDYIELLNALFNQDIYLGLKDGLQGDNYITFLFELYKIWKNVYNDEITKTASTLNSFKKVEYALNILQRKYYYWNESGEKYIQYDSDFGHNNIYISYNYGNKFETLLYENYNLGSYNIFHEANLNPQEIIILKCKTVPTFLFNNIEKNSTILIPAFMFDALIDKMDSEEYFNDIDWAITIVSLYFGYGELKVLSKLSKFDKLILFFGLGSDGYNLLSKSEPVNTFIEENFSSGGKLFWNTLLNMSDVLNLKSINPKKLNSLVNDF
ncbi:MAG: hypothetical protein MJ211_16020, partial [Bacteroidales bacterium]|nr:hypothetical protein [Bacteroidales bacterium]